MTRSHAEIVRSAGAPQVFSTLRDEGIDLGSVGRVHAWTLRDSIPGEYWNAFARAGFATLEELAAHAETKKVVAAAVADAVCEGAISEIRSAARDMRAPTHSRAAPDQ